MSGSEDISRFSNGVKAVMFSSLLALQFGLQPIIVKHFHGSRGEEIKKTTIVIATELSKIFIATCIISSDANSLKETKNVLSNFSIFDSLKVAALPATLYAIQNLLNQHAYQLLDATTFNLMNQTKTLSAALFCYFILGKPQSIMQVLALVLLLSAAVILNVNLSGITSGEGLFASHVNSLGIICVTIASCLSGLSAALTQKALTSAQPRPSFFFSAELAVYGIIFLIANAAYKNDLDSVDLNMFSKWTLPDYIPVLTNALGGLIIGQVTKYAGGVRKGFALIAGILVTVLFESTICHSGLIGDMISPCKQIEAKTVLAFVLVATSIYLHSQFPPSSNTKKQKTA